MTISGIGEDVIYNTFYSNIDGTNQLVRWAWFNQNGDQMVLDENNSLSLFAPNPSNGDQDPGQPTIFLDAASGNISAASLTLTEASGDISMGIFGTGE